MTALTALPRRPDAPSCLARPRLATLVGDLVPAADLLGLLLALLAGQLLMGRGLLPDGLAAALHGDLGPAAAVAAVLAPFMLYDPRFSRRADRAEHRALASAHALRFAVYALVVLVLALVSGAPRGAALAGLGAWLAACLLATSTTRAIAAATLQRLRASGRLTEAVAVVGAGPAARGLVRALHAAPARSIELVGVFDDDRRTLAGPASIDALVALAGRRRIDWILLVQDPAGSPQRQAQLQRLRALGVAIGFCPQPLGVAGGAPARLPAGGGIAVGLLAARPIQQWDAIVKAAEDRLLGALITLALLPVLALVALAIRIDSPGPVLFRQRRHALDNREFDILKFRTMRWDPAGTARPLVQTARGDPRITRVGRILRATSLDELPQLFNVLGGTMSLVGPRPHAVDMRTQALLGTQITGTYPHRHRVRPGMTGWAQVNGARGATTTVEQLRRRVALDLHYIEHWSLWLDLRILARTPGVVLRRTDAF